MDHDLRCKWLCRWGYYLALFLIVSIFQTTHAQEEKKQRCLILIIGESQVSQLDYLRRQLGTEHNYGYDRIYKVSSSNFTDLHLYSKEAAKKYSYIDVLFFTNGHSDRLGQFRFEIDNDPKFKVLPSTQTFSELLAPLRGKIRSLLLSSTHNPTILAKIYKQTLAQVVLGTRGTDAKTRDLISRYLLYFNSGQGRSAKESATSALTAVERLYGYGSVIPPHLIGNKKLRGQGVSYSAMQNQDYRSCKLRSLTLAQKSQLEAKLIRFIEKYNQAPPSHLKKLWCHEIKKNRTPAGL
jgi:hypothetical protein